MSTTPRPSPRARPRLFYMVREADPTGVSGVGLVAEVFASEAGWAVVCWLPGHTGAPSSVEVHHSLADVVHIHGHGGLTRLEPFSPPDYGPEAWETRPDRRED